MIRIMSKEDLEQYVLEKYDWTALEKDHHCAPVLATKDGRVIDGAHRVIAARALGVTLPVVYLDVDVVQVDPHRLETWLDKFINGEHDDSSDGTVT